LGGVIRDVVGGLVRQGRLVGPLKAAATGYQSVYVLEILLLIATLIAMAPLIGFVAPAMPTEKA
jgi:BCD family chlorophyll transporter-like MFS transporter